MRIYTHLKVRKKQTVAVGQEFMPEQNAKRRSLTGKTRRDKAVRFIYTVLCVCLCQVPCKAALCPDIVYPDIYKSSCEINTSFFRPCFSIMQVYHNPWQIQYFIIFFPEFVYWQNISSLIKKKTESFHFSVLVQPVERQSLSLVMFCQLVD